MLLVILFYYLLNNTYERLLLNLDLSISLNVGVVALSYVSYIVIKK